MSNKKEKDDIVIAIDGSEQKRSDCRRIAGNYYLVGDINIENSGHCYYFPDKEKFFRIETGYIVYDHYLKRYNLKSMINFENGVVGLIENELIFGSFSAPLYYEPIHVCYKGKTYPCLSRDIFENSFWFKEDLSSGIYYHRQEIDCANFIIPQECNQNYKTSLDYDCKKSLNNCINIYNKLNENLEHEYYNIKAKAKAFGDYTFGFEFETINGFIPNDITRKLGLIPVRDGSIKGLEYVTIPLQGEKGVVTLLESLKQLQKRTEYDDSCSLHLHIGNIPRTEEFILALFKVLCLVEEKIFDLFPIYKKVNYGLKRKAYTKPFPFENTIFQMDPVIDDKNIKKNFDILIKYLSMGHSYSEYDFDIENIKSHPSDPGGNGKWNIKTRYHWVNIIPLLFGNKETVEFRIHTPTYDVDKIINYLILCISIVDFAKKNTSTILKKFNSIANYSLFDFIYPNIAFNSDLKYSLNDYINQRKNYIYHCVKNGDIVSSEENFNTRGSRIFNWDSKLNNQIKQKKTFIKKNPIDVYFDVLDNQVFPHHFGNPGVIMDNQQVDIPNEDLIHNFDDEDEEFEDWLEEQEI